jgi:hypothetical protein
MKDGCNGDFSFLLKIPCIKLQGIFDCKEFYNLLIRSLNGGKLRVSARCSSSPFHDRT